MKTVLVICVLVVMCVILGIGILALNNQVFVRGQAEQKCPVPVISEHNICPDENPPRLAKDSRGCYVLQCQ